MSPRALLALSLVLAAGVARAATPSVALEELTWTELRERVAAGATTILVPAGGTEQNGPHMTLGKHNARVAVLARAIAVELGNALVAPVIAYVPEGGTRPPTSHMRFPGTITVPDATFQAVLVSTGQSLRLAGFRDIVFLGDHGGYQKALRAAADALNREWQGTGVRAHALAEYYAAVESSYPQALRARGFRDDEIGTHAGLADTSLALAVDPRLVRADGLASRVKPSPSEGAYGDPRRASAALGQLGVDLIVAASVEAIRKATTRH
jgi:creatinine amidohydrolase